MIGTSLLLTEQHAWNDGIYYWPLWQSLTLINLYLRLIYKIL
jgi:hypothetical protein